jgi:putative ABC transport system permease protein
MGVVFGLAPALYSMRGDLAGAIREGGLQAGGNRQEQWTRAAFVVSQMALAMVVLVGAGLMIRTYRELLRLDVGYNAHNALTAQLALPPERYPTRQTISAFYDALVERLGSSRGIESAAVATGRPMMDRVVDVSTQDFFLPGQEGEPNVANTNVRVVTPGYFDVAGMRLIRGRLLGDSDTRDTEPVAVVNQTMARLYWPRQDAVGRSIRLGTLYSNGAGIAPPGQPSEAGRGSPPQVKIVGVVSDARQVRVIEVPVRQEIFFPMAQRPELARAVTVVVRSRLPTDQVASLMRRAVAAIDPDRPIYDLITLEQAVSDSFAVTRLATVLLGLFAAVAMTLASVGLYAIVAYSVSRRTRDIGIRMALGASRREVLGLAIREGWRLAAVGLTAGVVAALLSVRLMQSLVFDVSTTDPLTFAAAGVLLAAVAMVASYVPARRATRIDPAIALRCE